MEWSEDVQRNTIASLPGGQVLIDWYGGVPSFHDDEIVGFDMVARGTSSMRVRCSRYQDGGSFVVDEERVVTLSMERIVDLQLEGFSPQNVVFEILLGPAEDRPDRAGMFFPKGTENDLDIQLNQTYGLCGFVRCQGVSISLGPVAKRS